MRRLPWLLAVMLLGTWGGSAHAADVVGGRLLLLDICPGDTIRKAEGTPPEVAPLVAALLTPILSSVITDGFKAWGAKLSEDAQEANFDVIHRGSHLYRYVADDKRFGLSFACVIVASQGVLESKNGLAELATGYESHQIMPAGGFVPDSAIKATEALSDKLEEVGFSLDQPPAVLAVFDVELSAQRREVRLVPRFIAMDHSVREKKRDSRGRAITFEWVMQQPSAEKPFANPSFKVDGLRSTSPIIYSNAPSDRPESSDWFALPALSPVAQTRLDETKDYETRQKVSMQVASLALDAAITLGETSLARFGGACPKKDESLVLWVKSRSALALERAKAKDKQTSLPRLEAADLFFTSCIDYYDSANKLEGALTVDGYQSNAFDVTLTLREFRQRPFAKFFGGIFSKDAVATAVSTAITAKIDPVKTAADEKARIALKEAYETAVIAAENAILAYSSAAEADKPAKFIEMESKKRVANRRARDIEWTLPYPDSGFWFD